MAKKKPYLTSEQLAEQLEISQKEGKPTVELCNMFRLIAQHFLGDARYRRYDNQMHQDMISAALEKCLKNVKNYNPKYRDRCFNYYTRCIEHAFYSVLGNHYKQINLKRQLMMESIEAIEKFRPNEAQWIKDRMLEDNTTNFINGED